MVASFEHRYRSAGHVDLQAAGTGLQKQCAALDVADFGIHQAVRNECGTNLGFGVHSPCQAADQHGHRPDRNNGHLNLHAWTLLVSVELDPPDGPHEVQGALEFHECRRFPTDDPALDRSEIDDQERREHAELWLDQIANRGNRSPAEHESVFASSSNLDLDHAWLRSEDE